MYGVIMPVNPQVAAIGTMQIAPFSDGLSLFQDYKRLFYRFSPYNDYTVDRQNNRSSFISIPQIENNQYTTDLEKPVFERIGLTLYSYLSGGNPAFTVTTTELTAHYETNIQDKTAVITRTVTFEEPRSLHRIGTTISYNGDDIVFDRALNVYNYWESSDLTAFEQIYGATLTPQTDMLQVSVPDRKVYIMNPHAAFLIAVHARPDQSLRINRDAKLIEIEETVQPGTAYITSVIIEILSSPKEVL